MFFDYKLGIEDIGEKKINCREAVRAVVVKDGKLLMVRTNRGDYKLPGGGVNEDEDYEDALARELQEETGYLVKYVKGKIGKVLERKKDSLERDSIFEGSSHYYTCEVLDETTSQNLQGYEKDLEFEPVWVDIDEVIEVNNKILANDNRGIKKWVGRENMILRTIKDYLYI